MPPSIPWDIISLIAQQLYLNEVLKDLLSFCLVSHDFYNASIPWLYRRIDLSLNGSRETQLIISQIESDKAKYVHEFHVGPGASAKDNDRVSSIEALIRRLPALRQFKWGHKSLLSNQFLEYLSQAQSVRDIQLFYDVTNKFSEKLLPPAMSGNSKLTALDLQIRWDITVSAGNPNTRHCRKMILEAPALESLNLTWAHDPHGVEFYPSIVPNIQFSRDQTLPAIKSLVLKSCLIVRDQARSESPLQISTIQTLRLKKIPLECLNFFLTELLLAKKKLRLKIFEISESHSLGVLSYDTWQRSLIQFLHAFTGLEKLILYGHSVLAISLPNVIVNHGETLKTLKIHNPGLHPYPCATVEDIQGVCDHCPNLQELTLDLFRNSNGFDDAMLNTLQAFPRLRKLEIFTPLNDVVDIMQLFKPVVDASFVHNAAIRLRGRRLKQLLIQVGEKFTVLEMWRLPEEYQWENRHRSSWHIDYLDDGQGFMAQETAQDAYDIGLMELTNYLGLPHDPPQEWSAFTVWRDRLLSQIPPQARMKLTERIAEAMSFVQR